METGSLCGYRLLVENVRLNFYREEKDGSSSEMSVITPNTKWRRKIKSQNINFSVVRIKIYVIMHESCMYLFNL